MRPLLLLPILFSLIGFKALGSDTANTTCQAIFKAKESKEEGNSFLDNVKAIFSSNKLEINYTKTLNDNGLSLYSDVEATENYIFLFKPHLDQATLDKYLYEYDSIKEQIELAQDNLEKLVDTRSIADCEIVFKKHPITEQGYNDLFVDLRSNKELNNYLGYKESIKQIRRAQRRGLYNTWKIIESTHVNHLSKVLRDVKTANVIVVAHSSSSGFMVDSNSNIISPSVFKDISKGIQSVHLFTCYGSKVQRNYKINQELKENSFQRSGLYSTIESSHMGDKTPIKSFSSYFRKIDRKVKLLKKGNSNVKPAEKTLSKKQLCVMNIKTSNELGSFSVHLNNHFIANPVNTTNKYWFDCSFLTNKNVIIISNSLYIDNELDDFFKIELDNYRIAKAIQFKNELGLFDGSHILLEKE